MEADTSTVDQAKPVPAATKAKKYVTWKKKIWSAGKCGKKTTRPRRTWDDIHPEFKWEKPAEAYYTYRRLNGPLGYLAFRYTSNVFKDQWIIADNSDVVRKSNKYLKFVTWDYLCSSFKVLKDVHLPFQVRAYDEYPN